jgi:hypothetical protein
MSVEIAPLEIRPEIRMPSTSSRRLGEFAQGRRFENKSGQKTRSDVGSNVSVLEGDNHEDFQAV